MAELVAALVLVPLAWASAAFVLGPGRGGRLAVLGLGVQSLLALRLAGALGEGLPILTPAGGWDVPLGIEFAIDGLAVTMLLLTQFLGLALALYARAYFDAGDPERRYIWPLLGLLIAGLDALFVTADLFNAYVTLEIVGLAAVGLVGAGGEARRVRAALRYLFATLVGSSCYLLGVALIYGAYGAVSFSTLAPFLAAELPRAVQAAGVLMLVGLMIKSALLPFHGWLPPAHGSASTPVSALLSALVVKAAFYLILRLWLTLFAAQGAALAWLPAVLGAAAVLWGSWRAITAVRLKTLVAYSTVAQLGYLFLVFPLLAGVVALQAVMMQVVAHGLAKAAMFAAAGILVTASGQDRVAGLQGMAQQRPLTLGAFALAGVTLMGLPPSAGFLAKWLLIESALGAGQWSIVAVVLAGGLLAAIYVFRVLREAMLEAAPATGAQPVPRSLEWVAFTLAGASVLLGLRGGELISLLAPGAGT